MFPIPTPALDFNLDLILIRTSVKSFIPAPDPAFGFASRCNFNFVSAIVPGLDLYEAELGQRQMCTWDSKRKESDFKYSFRLIPALIERKHGLKVHVLSSEIAWTGPDFYEKSDLLQILSVQRHILSVAGRERLCDDEQWRFEFDESWTSPEGRDDSVAIY
ncbi:hypothetical protein EVAR_7472_1 [Eumeta japonica]|uniref:Uncharacterized protein n=1 Tax=Eumeta variegata TaxID=151549 RepID=A0A4C1Y2R9_EUMVA|nr:hypothetical protein EVAR_7472_1 [Eumeta japonica]